MIKNIIFDWSGTLSDDLIPVYNVTMKVFKKVGLKSITLKKFKKEFTLPYMIFYKKFKENVNKENIDKLFSREIDLIDSPKLFLETEEVLRFLKQKEIKMVLLSSCSQKQLEEDIENYKFQDFFVDINGSVHNKVKTITEIMCKNNFKPKETIYIGDMTHDIDAGKKAGISTVAVSYGYQSKEKLLEKNPDFLIENLKELKNIVLSI